MLFVGWGTNMLFAFDTFKWIVIKNSLNDWTYNHDTKKLEAYSNIPIREIAESIEKKHWQDLWHRFIWLPGSIGGAIFWNAWCFWLETENNFVKATVLNLKTWKIEDLNKSEMNFSYRSSLLKEDNGKYFLIKAQFDLSKKVEKYHSDVDNLYFREYKQPKWNTCGSFFKNPNRKQSAGYLIEQVWLKWHSTWGAYFSDLHANFLMHDGKGKWQDLVDLIELAQEKVSNQFWVDLINEVRIIKW
jgi:UDP-N-acetylmuramate dehydrogenase